jgi:hypothetical protein
MIWPSSPETIAAASRVPPAPAGIACVHVAGTDDAATPDGRIQKLIQTWLVLVFVTVIALICVVTPVEV